MKEVLVPEISCFFSAIRDDNRISPIHISLFMAIVQHWEMKGCKESFHVFGHELMWLAKISGVATYYKGINELNEYGYIKYKPSYNHHVGSLIYLKADKVS